MITEMASLVFKSNVRFKLKSGLPMNSSVKGWRKTRTKKPRVWQKALGFSFLGKVLKR